MSIMAPNTSEDSNPARVRISGIPVTMYTELEVLRAMDDNIKVKRLPQYIVITNTESMYYARRLRDHADFIEGAAFSCCDGVGVVLAGRAQGVSVNRIYGSNLVKAACQFGEQRSWRHFFYGGMPGVPEILKRKLEACSPGMLTAGTWSPPFRPLTPEEDDAAINRINDSGCDIVWVGLGLLKQERWIAAHRDRIRAPWMVGIGAAFDYHAGTVARAPLWVQRVGFEWLHRVFHQPRMLVRNYRSFVFLGESLLHRSSHSHNSPTTPRRSPA
jgi:N-acetylglucosaminyldiphosphoundecaprenol N-acetyl-beta-D-mannosaminyltransferase